MFRIADLLRRTWTAAVTRRHTVKCSPPPSTRFRPQLEGLTERVVPTLMVY